MVCKFSLNKTVKQKRLQQHSTLYNHQSSEIQPKGIQNGRVLSPSGNPIIQLVPQPTPEDTQGKAPQML